MIQCIGRLVVLVAFFALAPLTAATAQTVAGNLQDLRSKVRDGDTVYVTDDAGLEVKGTILALSAASLTLAVDGARVDLAEGRIRQIKKRGVDPLWQGALIGAGVGMSPILFYCGAASESGEKCSDQGKNILLFGAIGAAIGTGVDALIMGKRRIYQASGGKAPVTVALSPVLSSRARGVHVSLRF